MNTASIRTPPEGSPLERLTGTIAQVRATLRRLSTRPNAIQSTTGAERLDSPHADLIVGRGLCMYRREDYSNVPRNRRRAAVEPPPPSVEPVPQNRPPLRLVGRHRHSLALGQRQGPGRPRSPGHPRRRGCGRQAAASVWPGRGQRIVSIAISYQVRGCRVAQRACGFTLLETIVAMTIFAGAGMALYALFNTNLMSLAKVRDISAQLPPAYRAAEYVGSINPMVQPQRAIELDGYHVTWSAHLLDPVRQSQSVDGYVGLFEVGLFEVVFDLSEAGRSTGVYRLRVVGYRKVRELDL
ncbi:MAG: prepilin-type N-terminal cleavage/methylation domain-containing protein [Gammaproteobacteria bacterium]|nr:prepilin-type N-terminal cleavage/methylation domain-containing protein [Gammaproteobacteria bacterium]